MEAENFFGKVWGLLVDEGGASVKPLERQHFLYTYTEMEKRPPEYVVGGRLGMRTKFLFEESEGYFACRLSTEDLTEANKEAIEKVNAILVKYCDKYNREMDKIKSKNA